MADIASTMTFVTWLRAKTDPIIDFSDEFLYATMYGRGITDDSTVPGSVTEKVRDLCLADIYLAAATSSTKSGTQGEADGGWTHYIAIKNVVSRDALRSMAKALYDKWDETYDDPSVKITLSKLY